MKQLRWDSRKWCLSPLQWYICTYYLHHCVCVYIRQLPYLPERYIGTQSDMDIFREVSYNILE